MGVTAVAVALAVTLVAGCGSGGNDQLSAAELEAVVPDGSTPVSGWISADGDVTGAKVELQDDSGAVLAEAMEPTNSNGTWTAVLDSAPKSLRVVATGGEDETGPIDGEIVSVEDPFEPNTALHAGPATTLLAAWLEANPGESFDQAREQVARFLELPPDWDINADTRVPFGGFSGREMTRELRAAGGIDAFIDQLVQEMKAGKTHPFPSPPSNQAVANPATSGVTTKILTTLLSGSLQAIVGHAERGETQKDLDKIQGELDDVTSQLGDIENQLNDIEKQLAINDYVTKTTPLDNTVEFAGIAYDDLSLIADAYDGDGGDPTAAEQTLAKSRSESFLNFYDNDPRVPRPTLANGPDAINQALASGGADSSALQVWTQAHTSYTRLWSATSQANAGGAVNYWAGIMGQVLASNYAYADAEPNSGFDVDQWMQQYPAPNSSGVWQGNFGNWLQAAGLAHLAPMPEGVVLDQATETLWWADTQTPEPTSYAADTTAAIGRGPGGGWSAPSKDQIGALLGISGTYAGWANANPNDNNQVNPDSTASGSTNKPHSYGSPAAWLADYGLGAWVKTPPTTCNDDPVRCTPNQWAYTTDGQDLPPQFQGDHSNCYELDGANKHTENCRNKAYDLKDGSIKVTCTTECDKARRLRNVNSYNQSYALWGDTVNYLLLKAYANSSKYRPFD